MSHDYVSFSNPQIFYDKLATSRSFNEGFIDLPSIFQPVRSTGSRRSSLNSAGKGRHEESTVYNDAKPYQGVFHQLSPSTLTF